MMFRFGFMVAMVAAALIAVPANAQTAGPGRDMAYAGG